MLEASGFAIRQMFATPVITAPLACAASLNEALLPAILAREASEPGVGLSNLGGWQSGCDFLDWGGQAALTLAEAARGLADRLTGSQTPLGLQASPPAWRVEAWANVSRAGHANAAHHHGGAFWSGAYWVDAGEPDSGGELELHDPRGILAAFAAPHLRIALPGCLSAGGSDFLIPVSGTLALFPSWLVHSVRPYRGARPRISVAFNFAV